MDHWLDVHRGGDKRNLPGMEQSFQDSRMVQTNCFRLTYCHFVHHGDEHEDIIMELISENLGELEESESLAASKTSSVGEKQTMSVEENSSEIN